MLRAPQAEAQAQEGTPAPTAAQAAPADVQGGTITGTVASATAADANGKKPAGTPLPGVTITATNTLTGRKYTAATDVSGAFRMTIPRNGRYVLRAEFVAFAPATSEVLLNATQHEGKAAFELELASRVAARNAAAGTPANTVAALTGAGGTQALGRGLQALRAAGTGDALTEDASAGGGTDGIALPTMSSLGGADASGSDSVAVSGQNGQINGLAGFNEDDVRNRIQGAIDDAQRQGGANAAVANAVVGLIGGMMQGGPGGFGGGPGGFGGGPGGGGPGGFGGGGFGGRGGFRNFNPTAIHGNLYYYAGNAALDATQFSITGNALKPAYSTNNFGASFTGSPFIPGLVKPSTKQTLFISYTGARSQNPQNIYATVPTADQRAGNFNGLTTQTSSGEVVPLVLYDPATGQPIPNNDVSGRISPQAANLLQYIPAPTNNADINNYQRITTAGSHSDQLSMRFNRTLGNAPTPQGGRGGRGGGGGGARGGNRQQPQTKVLRQSINSAFAYSHSASDIRGLLPSLDGKTYSEGLNASAGYNVGYGRISNNFTLGWNASHAETTNAFTYTPTNPGLGLVPAPTGVPTGLYNGVPGLTFANFSVSDTQPSDRRQETFSISNVVAWRTGKHNFRFGVDGRRLHNDLVGGTNGLGTFNFTGYATQNPATSTATCTSTAGGAPPPASCTPSGSSFADFLLGAPQNSGVQAGTNKIYLREWVYDWYAQDDWRLTSNISLTLGLRYEYFSPYIENNNRLVNLDHNADFSSFSRVCPGVCADGSNVGTYTGAFPRSLVQPDRSLYSPRLGVAWRPKFTKNTVVRGGYGINYNIGQYATFANSLSNQQPFAVSQNNTALTPGSAADGCGNFTTPGSTGSTFTLANAFNCASSSVLQNTFAINKNYRLGRVQVVNMDIQRTLPLGTVMNIGYNGSFASSLDLRRAPNRTPTNAQPIVYEDSIGESRFHSLSVNVRKRLQKGVALAATYQYGHSIDDASSIGGAGGNTIVQNDACISCEYGNSSFDVRHKLTGTFTLELPFGPNRAFLAKGGTLSRALTGIGIIGTYTLASGTYATPQYVNSSRQAATGNNFTLRPDRVFTQPIKGAGNLLNWFNRAAFVSPPTDSSGNLLHYGTASRNSIELPGTVSVNMSLVKTISLGDIRNLEARIQASNVFNTVQYTSVSTVVNASNFGAVTGTAAPRKLSFQARYRF